MQLIKITTTPMEYEIKIEKPSLVEKEIPAAEQYRQEETVRKEPAGVEQCSDQAALRAQTDNTVAQTTEYSSVTTQAAAAVQKNTVADFYRTRTLSSTAPADTVVSAQEAEVDSDMLSDIQASWDSNKKEMEFVPGKFHLEIINMPEVNIEYLGGPMYVPPSAAPEYLESR